MGGTFITFDLDGTLEDSRPDMVAAVGRVRAALGLPPRTYAAHIADETRLYPGIPEALTALGERATLAIATNKPEHLSRLLLDALGIGQHFVTVVGGDTASAPKPSEVVMEAALNAAGLDRASLDAVFHVGDTAGDMKLARNAKITGVWAAWGYVDAPGDEAPDRVARTPADLASVVFPD
jgi:phosphoglycolate phosphatase